MAQSSAERSHGAPAAAKAAAVLLVAWLVAAPLSTAVSEIVLGLALAAALVARAAGPRPESWPYGWRSLLLGGPSTRPVPWLLLAFATWYVVSAFAGVDPHTSVAKLPKLFRYALFSVPLAIAWRAGHWRAAFWLQVPLVIVLGLLGARALAAGLERAQTYNLHYNTLAQVAAMSSLWLLSASLYGPAAARRERLLLLLGCALATVVMVSTLSRAAWLAWWAAAVALVLFRLSRRGALISAACLVLLPVLALPLVREVRKDLFDLSHPEFTRRYDMWRMAVAAIREHPLTGLGPGGLEAVYDQYKTGVLIDDPRRWIHVHNDLLGVALNHGLPALAIWLVLTAILYRTAVVRLIGFRRGTGSWPKAGFAAVAASLHLFTMFGIVHENHPIYVKSCTMLLLWGLLVATDRALASASVLNGERPGATVAGWRGG